MGHKCIRRNYYRNSAAKKRDRMMRRFTLCIKTAAVAAALLSVSFMFIFGYDFLTQCGYFNAERLIVTGSDRLLKEDVLQQAKVNKGVNILSINLSMVRKRLCAHSWIEDAEVSRELPSGIMIRIKEQKPLAVLDLGRKFIINIHGEIFKEMDSSDPVNLPFVSGLEFSDIDVGDEHRSVPLNAVMNILELGKKSQSVLPYKSIKRIQVDREIGLTVYAFDNIGAVKIGYSDYPSKTAMLKDILLYLKKSSDFSYIESIDLNNLNRIVVNPAKIESAAVGHKEV